MGMGRVGEAFEEAKGRLDTASTVTAFAARLLAVGGEWTPKAFEWVEAEAARASSSNTHDRHAYQRLLSEQCLKQGRADRALEIEQRRFASFPSEATDDATKRAAKGLPKGDTWRGLRPRLLDTFREMNGWETLAGFHTEGGEVREALAALDRADSIKPSAPRYGAWPTTLSIRLQERMAKVAEEEFPAEASALYYRMAELSITHQGRENYRMASGCLLRHEGDREKAQGQP